MATIVVKAVKLWLFSEDDSEFVIATLQTEKEKHAEKAERILKQGHEHVGKMVNAR